MLKIKEYIKPKTLAEAYELNQKKGNVILGGMLWLKLSDKRVNTAIDLSGLELDTIEETKEAFRIGAMVSLRQMEQYQGLNHYTGNAVKEALKPIVGVQFRNCATLGGSVFGRYGFSDVLTLLLAMDTYVELYQRGVLPLEQFLVEGGGRDILTAVIIKKVPLQIQYISQRNTKTDFAVLNCAVAKRGGNFYCTIGARPGRAVRFVDEENILADGITEESAAAFARHIQEQVKVGSNMRAGAEYRRRIAKVLVRRALLAMEGDIR